MKKSIRILFVLFILLFSGSKGYTQTVTQKNDTLTLQTQQQQNATDESGITQKGNAYGQDVNKNGAQAVKRVKGSRPDMSKAKGARPPTIVRPSGSGIPKGIGKPGGVGKKGGR